MTVTGGRYNINVNTYAHTQILVYLTIDTDYCSGSWDKYEVTFFAQSTLNGRISVIVSTQVNRTGWFSHSRVFVF